MNFERSIFHRCSLIDYCVFESLQVTKILRSILRKYLEMLRKYFLLRRFLNAEYLMLVCVGFFVCLLFM